MQEPWANCKTSIRRFDSDRRLFWRKHLGPAFPAGPWSADLRTTMESTHLVRDNLRSLAGRPVIPCQPREVHALERVGSGIHREIHVIGFPKQGGPEIEAQHVSHHVHDGH